MNARQAAVPAPWVAYLAAGAAASVAFVTVHSPWIQGFLQIAAYAASALLVLARWARSSRTRPDPLVGFAAVAFGLFAAANVLGVLWPLTSDGPVPVPSPLDGLFLLSFLLLAVFLWRLGSRAAAGDKHEWLDPLIVVLGVAPVFWLFLVDPLIRGSVTVVLLTYLAYPAMVFVLLAITVRTAFVSFRRSVPHLLLAGFIVLELTADVAYLQVGAVGGYAYGQAYQALWVASAGCVGALALHPDAGFLLERHTSRPSNGRARLLLLGGFLSLPILTLTVSALAGMTGRHVLIPAVAALVLVVLVCLRLSELMVDIAEQRRVRMALQQKSVQLIFQSLHDPLTGLGNRALFAERADHALAQRVTASDRGAVVLLLDLDDFKAVNDTYGHDAGDEILVGVARRLDRVTRRAESVFRLAGDEFAFVLPQARLGDGLRLADRIREALAEPFELGRRQVMLEASIGMSIALHSQDRDTLLAEADLAMYDAKNRSRPSPSVFDPELHREALDRAQLDSDLRAAAGRGELRLLYQPLVELSTNDMVGVEALLRWEHPTRGTISPVQFIPLAEQNGAILRIGDWVLTEACRQLRVWDVDRPEKPLRLSVNVSPRQLADPEFVGRVAATLRVGNVDPARVTLEVTETAFGTDTDLMVARLHELRQIGVNLAIDDFGTGYSSLSQLRRLPVDVLKIDKSFVAGVAAGRADWELTSAVIHLAAGLGKVTLAEGIETGGQLAHLRSLRVELGQGYLFAPPLHATAITGLLHAPVGRAFLHA